MYSVEIFVISIMLCSVYCWFKPQLKDQLLLDIWAIKSQKEWYRLLSSAFVHGDIFHLIFNIFWLYDFGKIFISSPSLGNYKDVYFVCLFLGSVLFSNLVTYRQHADNIIYKSLGASGGVWAVTITSTLLLPNTRLCFFKNFSIKAWQLIPFLMVREGLFRKYHHKKNINYTAHFAGAFFGLIFAIWINPNVLFHACQQIISG